MPIFAFLTVYYESDCSEELEDDDED